MKKLFTLVAVALFSLGMSAQSSLPTPEDYQHLAETHTYVVLDDNIMSDFNLAIEGDMKKEWTPTKFDLISRKEFEEKRQDPSNSFILTTTVTYEKDKTKARYTYLSLLLGKDKSKVNTMPDLISIPLAYTSVEDQKYVYKMNAFIRFILKHVELMKENPKLISKTPLVYYNKNIKSLNGKTLYLLRDEMHKSLQTEAAIKKVYSHPFKFVTEEEIQQAIVNREKDVVFLHKVGPEVAKYNTRCFKILMGADDSEIYYFDYHNIDKDTPDRFLPQDFKRINKSK